LGVRGRSRTGSEASEVSKAAKGRAKSASDNNSNNSNNNNNNNSNNTNNNDNNNSNNNDNSSSNSNSNKNKAKSASSHVTLSKTTITTARDKDRGAASPSLSAKTMPPPTPTMAPQEEAPHAQAKPAALPNKSEIQKAEKVAQLEEKAEGGERRRKRHLRATEDQPVASKATVGQLEEKAGGANGAGGKSASEEATEDQPVASKATVGQLEEKVGGASGAGGENSSEEASEDQPVGSKATVWQLEEKAGGASGAGGESSSEEASEDQPVASKATVGQLEEKAGGASGAGGESSSEEAAEDQTVASKATVWQLEEKAGGASGAGGESSSEEAAEDQLDANEVAQAEEKVGGGERRKRPRLLPLTSDYGRPQRRRLRCKQEATRGDLTKRQHWRPPVGFFNMKGVQQMGALLDAIGSRSWSRDASGSQERRCVLRPVEAKEEGEIVQAQANPEFASVAPEPGPVPRRRPSAEAGGGEDVPCRPFGLPQGWTCFARQNGPTSKNAGKTYLRCSSDALHKSVNTVAAAIRLDAADRGLDPEEAVALHLAAKEAQPKLDRTCRPFGLPQGWTCFARQNGPTNKNAGKTYLRCSSDALHKNVNTVAAAIRLDAADRGLDPEEAVALHLAAKEAQPKLDRTCRPFGLPQGWTCFAQQYGPTSKNAGKTYLRCSSDALHKSVNTVAAAIRLDAADRGLDPEEALALHLAAKEVHCKAKPKFGKKQDARGKLHLDKDEELHHSAKLTRPAGQQSKDAESPAASSKQSELSPEELEGIMQSIRCLPEAERPAAMAALPDVPRRCLLSHCKDEYGGTCLNLLLAHLPELPPAATLQQRRELLEGVLWLQATHATTLAAPDMAAVNEKLREVSRQQGQALIEAQQQAARASSQQNNAHDWQSSDGQWAPLLADGPPLCAVGGGAVGGSGQQTQQPTPAAAAPRVPWWCAAMHELLRKGKAVFGAVA
ncbi:unnamed protein product, partial [Polarella glacialis]